MNSFRDSDGAPPRRVYAPRTHDRVIAEMLGLVKGVVCDGVVTDGEAVALTQWLANHAEAAVTFPGNVIAQRLHAVFQDGILEEEERQHLLELLRDIVGETEDQSGLLDRAARIPLNQPFPTVFFDGKEFCFTGKFAFGPRTRCEDAVSQRGGRCTASVSKHTDYVVIGLVGSPAWVQSTHGTKIEHAVHLRELGHGVAIISEEHWLESVHAEE